MRKFLTVVLSLTLLIWVFPISASAEEVLKAPTVQFKLIDHDQIALRWSKIEGADYYYVYRTNTETGKTVRYNKEITGTTVKISGLKAETDYIFKVSAVSEKDGQITIGNKSRGTYVTTPSEWIYTTYANRSGTWTYKHYKENYSKTRRQSLDLGNNMLYIAEEIVYYNGWIYGIRRDGDYVFRIKEDGTDEEVLYDRFGLGAEHEYKINGDYIYIHIWNINGVNNGTTDNREVTLSEYQKISLKTGEVTKVFDAFFSHNFDVNDNYIYYIYDENEYDNDLGEYVFSKNNDIYLCRIKNDGTNNEVIGKLPDYVGKIYVYNDEAYFYYREYAIKNINDGANIYKISLSNGEITSVCKEPTYINNFEIVNSYIYFTEYGNMGDQYYKVNPIAYYRVKTDGTGLTKSDKPFEWKY